MLLVTVPRQTDPFSPQGQKTLGQRAISARCLLDCGWLVLFSVSLRKINPARTEARISVTTHTFGTRLLQRSRNRTCRPALRVGARGQAVALGVRSRGAVSPLDDTRVSRAGSRRPRRRLRVAEMLKAEVNLASPLRVGAPPAPPSTAAARLTRVRAP